LQPQVSRLFDELFFELELENSRSLSKVNPIEERIIGMGSSAVPTLVAALADPIPEIRRKAAELLGDISDPASAPYLISTFTDSLVSFDGEKALFRIGTGAVDDLITALADPSQIIRAKSIDLLGQIGDQKAVNALIDLLTDSDVYIRQMTVNALGRLGDIRSLEPIIGRLHDDSSLVRLEATAVLEWFGDMRAIQPLKQLLSDDDDRVQKAAQRTLNVLENIEKSKLDNKIR